MLVSHIQLVQISHNHTYTASSPPSHSPGPPHSARLGFLLHSSFFSTYHLFWHDGSVCRGAAFSLGLMCFVFFLPDLELCFKQANVELIKMKTQYPGNGSSWLVSASALHHRGPCDRTFLFKESHCTSCEGWWDRRQLPVLCVHLCSFLQAKQESSRCQLEVPALRDDGT